MPRGTGIMYIIFSRRIGCTLEPSVLRGHIAPTEPVENIRVHVILYRNILHTHTRNSRARTHVHTYTQQYTPNTHTNKKKKKKKKDRVQRIRSKRLCAMRKKEGKRKKGGKKKKERNSFLDRCVPTGRKNTIGTLQKYKWNR